MSELAYKSDSDLIVTMTIGQLRELIRSEIAAAQNGHGVEKDRLLTPDEAAEILGESKRWLYRHQRQLPFIKRLSRKSLRFREAGLRRWMAAKGS